MAICANVQRFKELVDEFIAEYERIAADDTLADLESTPPQDTLERLYAYRDAIKKEDLKFINSLGLTVNSLEKQSALLNQVFRDTFGDTFGFKYNGGGPTVTGRLVNIAPKSNGVTVTFTDNGKSRSFNFASSTDSRSTDSKSGKHIVIPGFRRFLDNYETVQQKRTAFELIFGNEGVNEQLGEEYRNTDYIHGSLDHMKALLKKLHLLGGEKASQEELDSYLALLDKMKPDFFDKLKLYINEEAEKSDGMVSSKRIDININGAPRTKGNQQSEASIYMEEVLHSMTAAAIHSNTPASRQLERQLDYLIELARKQLAWKDFLPATSINSKEEEAYAKWLYNYIFTGKNAKYEFLAKAIAQPEVANALKNVKVVDKKDNRRFWERINDLLDMVINIFRGNFSLKNRSKNVQEALVNLAYDFGEINSKAARKLQDEGTFLTKVFDLVNNSDAELANMVNNIKDSALSGIKTKDLEKMPETLYEKVKFIAKYFTLALVNPVYTKAMGAVATSWGLKPDSTVREIIGGMFATDSAQKVAEFLVMQSGYIDKQRNNQIDLVRKNILSEFINKVSKDEEEALTAIFADTDLAALAGKDSIAKDTALRQTSFDSKTIRRLLTDDEFLDRLIQDSKRGLKELDEVHYNWHSNQAVGLGIYMATHRGTPEQNLNASNIARGIHSSHRKKPNKKVVKGIDELSTLVAIKNSDKDQRTLVAELMKREVKGVQHVMDVVAGFTKNSEATVFKNGRTTNQIKGYTREVFDDSIAMEIAPLEDRERMEAQGYTYRGTLQARGGEVRNKPMALYVTDSLGRPERLRGTVRLNQIKAKGTTVTTAAFIDGEGFDNALVKEMALRDINNIQREAMERAKKMEEGEYDFTDTPFGLMPVINDDGKVTDYRYMMDKETKKSLLKQDTRISEVMARSFGSILDKDLSAQHNTKALQFITQDMNENWEQGTKGKDGLTDYTLVGPNVSDPEMRKLYYMLPKEFKDYVNRREDKTLAIRTDLKNIMFGYTQLSITDFPMLKKVTPQILIKLIKFIESMWVEMIKVVKTNILLKIPTILLSNAVSNFLYGVMRGYDPITLLKMHVDSYRDITNYNKDIKRLQELENQQRQIAVGLNRDILSSERKRTLSLELKRTQGELEALKLRIEKSPVHELVQLGLDQNVEDVTNDSERDANRITGYIDEKLENAPELLRNGLDILFITKRTKYYKIANEFLEISDLMSRDIQNRLEQKQEEKQVNGQAVLPTWWVETKEKGYRTKQRLTGEERQEFLRLAKQQRQYDLVEDFINYAKPSGQIEEYLNRVGILMFTKYVKRIQRIIMKTTGRAPVKGVVGALAFGWLGGLPSIHEQSFMVKDWYSDSIGPGNVFPVYSPIENFMTFITPALLKSSTYDFSL